MVPPILSSASIPAPDRPHGRTADPTATLRVAVVVCTPVKIAYVDEAGCTGALPSATSAIQPVFVQAAVVVDQAEIRGLTLDFLRLKVRFFPALGAGTGHFLDRVLGEVKGADLRKQVCDPGRRRRRQAVGFLDSLVALLEKRQVRLVGRVWIKGIGQPFNGRAVYTSSMQHIFRYFEHLLAASGELGLVVADSRTKPQNAVVAHSILTQKFAAGGDVYPHVTELPVYGHSENHVGLQVADLLCSALLFPMATASYCREHVSSVHVRPGHALLGARYGRRLRALQYRYREGVAFRGGLTVSDAIGGRPGRQLFEPPKSPDP